MMRRCAALMFAAAVALPAPAHAQSALGRLFFSPAERAALDRDTDTPSDAAESTPRTLNGIVRRSDGKATVWIDGQPQTRQLPSANAAPVEAPDGQWRRLKVGESTDGAAHDAPPKIRIERQR